MEKEPSPKGERRAAEPMVAADATLDEIAEVFSHDRFVATALSPVIEEARPGYARVRMKVEENHLNANGTLMGGATFTLCDFTCSIAASIGQPTTVSTNCSIDYVGVARTREVVAEAVIEKSGRTLAFGTVHVRDGEGNLVARMNATGFRRQ